MSQKPSVGRIVHYVSYGTPGGEFASECRAAIVTEVQDGVPFIGLAVLNPSGMFFHSMELGGCHYHEGEVEREYETNAPAALSYPGGTWHWPERVA